MMKSGGDKTKGVQGEKPWPPEATLTFKAARQSKDRVPQKRRPSQ